MEEKISRRRFIHLGTALGVGAAGASVLAACGGGGAGGESGNGSGGGGGEYGGDAGGGGSKESSGNKTDGGTEKQPSGGEAIARTSEVAPGSAVKFKDSGNPAVLVHLQSGDFVAYSAVCTHQQCTVATVADGTINCTCHGSKFGVADGSVSSGPATSPLPAANIKVDGDSIMLA